MELKVFWDEKEDRVSFVTLHSFLGKVTLMIKCGRFILEVKQMARGIL